MHGGCGHARGLTSAAPRAARWPKCSLVPYLQMTRVTEDATVFCCSGLRHTLRASVPSEAPPVVRFQVVRGAAGRVLTVVTRLLKGCQPLFAISPGGPLMENVGFAV